jgi:all-trans-retinol 13,14-reductase
MNYEYVVIGGGISGMTTALILAKHGCRVALVERSGKIAPTVRGFTRSGLFFDTGFHYSGGLEPGGPLDIFFRYLGLSDNIETYLFKKDGFDSLRCLDPRFEFPYPYGYDKLKESFHRAFPGDKKAVDEYFRTVKKIYSSLPYVDLDARGEPVSFSAVTGPSLQEFLDGLTDNGLLKCVLSMHCFLYGVSPGEIPFANHACIAGSFYESVSGITGGGQSLANAFEASLEKIGVNVYCGQAAEKILVSGDGIVCGILLKDGSTLNCSGCVSTIHPHQLLEMVPDHLFRPAYVNRLKGLEDTSSACILFATCSTPVKDLQGSNLFIFPRPDFSFFNTDLAVEERPLYITAARSNGGPEKNGFIAICPMSNTMTQRWSDSTTGKRPAEYELFKQEMTEKVRCFIEASCPDIAGRIIDMECATPLTLRDYTNSPYGSIYGVKHRVGQYNPMPVTRLKGLYLAGQATTAPGIIGAIMSGFIACENIFGRNHLQEELKACRPKG